MASSITLIFAMLDGDDCTFVLMNHGKGVSISTRQSSKLLQPFTMDTFIPQNPAL